VFRRTRKAATIGSRSSIKPGWNWLGTQGWLADAEVLLLLADCLNQLSLSRVSLILGEAGITRLRRPSTCNPDKVRSAIAHLDRVAIETLPLSDELRSRARIILDLRGRPADWKNLPVWT